MIIMQLFIFQFHFYEPIRLHFYDEGQTLANVLVKLHANSPKVHSSPTLSDFMSKIAKPDQRYGFQVHISERGKLYESMQILQFCRHICIQNIGNHKFIISLSSPGGIHPSIDGGNS